MLERETDHIVGVLGQRSIGHAPSISLKDILASDILPAVRTFFRADVEAMALEEHRAALRSSRFRYDHPEVKHALADLHSSLVLHYVFGRDEYLARLGDAVHLLANYLVRPQWTLAGVIFEKESAMPVDSLRRLMSYFAPYEYYRSVLFRHAEERRISAFTKEEFPHLLWRIDAAYLRRKSGQEICDLLLPVFEFFDYPASTGSYAMPVKALIRFFEDKGMTDVQTRLEGEMAQGMTTATLRALAGILEDVRRTSGEFVAERPEPRSAAASDAPPPSEALHPAAAAPPPASARTGPDVSAAIQEGERRKFVRKIFREEDDRYDEAMRHLADLPGWKEASRYIDEIFIRNNVDPYSAEAERFTEIVFQQYHPPR